MEKIIEVKESLKKFFTKSVIKKICAVLVVGAIFTGGGVYYLHDQKVARKIASAQAQNIMIENLAQEKNITLISVDEVKSIVAKNIGVDAEQITFAEIYLKHSHDKGKKHFDEHDEHSENFQPIYKVKCFANNLKYKLYIDAVNGKILQSKVD